MERILHIVEAWQGGIASYLENLIRLQVKKGYEVVLAADTKLLRQDSRAIPCRTIPYTCSRNPFNFLKIRNQLQKIVLDVSPDVVHVHSTFPGTWTRFPTAIHPRIIYTPHGWAFLKIDNSKFIRRIYGLVEKILASRARAIVCMSYDEHKRAEGMGITGSKVVMIHTGLPDLIKRNSDRTLRDRFEPGITVGFFGRLDYAKGADLLTEVGAKLRDNTTLHVFGSGAHTRPPLAGMLGIVAHGWVDSSEIPSWMSRMDIIIIPSRWEGFCVTALESLRAGVPLIVSGSTSLTEVVIHGYNGLIMHQYSADHLAELINSLTSQECHRMGVNARSVYEETFTLEHFGSEILKLYRRVLSDA